MNGTETAPYHVKEQIIPARPCKLEDFSKNEEYGEIFNTSLMH